MFPGATADREAAAFAVVGAPLDVSTTFRPGTRFGPRLVRTHARGFEDFDRRTAVAFSALDVYDHGDVRAWDDARDYLGHLTEEVSSLVAGGAIPILIGGEHTISLAGVRATEPEVVVCLDAHLDLRDRYDGNPLSHACVSRRLLETVEELIIVGARSGSEPGWERAEAADVTVIDPTAVDPASIADRVGDRSLYCSFDIDAADPGIAPGTGTMEPFGLDGQTCRAVIRALAPRARGFDVVEVNDHDDGQAATLAAKCLRAFVYEAATTSAGNGK